MKLVWKIIAIIAAVLLVLGVALIAASLFTGGSLESIRNNVPLMNYERNLEGEEAHTLQLGIDVGRVYILPGETLRVEAENVLEREFVCALEAGVLSVHDRWGDSWADSLSRVLTLRQQEPVIRIYLPEGMALEHTELDMNAGIVDIRGLDTGTLALRMSAGELTADGLHATEAVLELSAGLVDLRALHTETLALRMSAGTALVSGTAAQGCSVDMSAGTAKLYLTGTAGDYTADIDCTAGSVRYDGREYSGEVRVGGGAGVMALRSGAGSVEVKFAA